MKRFKASFSVLVLVLFMSSQALADREGYSDDGDGAGILLLIILVIGGLIVMGGLATKKS